MVRWEYPNETNKLCNKLTARKFTRLSTQVGRALRHLSWRFKTSRGLCMPTELNEQIAHYEQLIADHTIQETRDAFAALTEAEHYQWTMDAIQEKNETGNKQRYIGKIALVHLYEITKDVKKPVKKRWGRGASCL